MSLKTYREKRDFSNSPEPYGKNKKKIPKLKFVVQKHAASHLHYDFRLEMKGVLKSWAVPKKPSLNAKIKRLAVHVEDHPLDYITFEGVIPKGHYGAGTVDIWDKGYWQPEGDSEKTYKKGNLTFYLYGEKLTGKWKLIRMKNSKNWLLFKIENDEKTALHDKIKDPKNLLNAKRKAFPKAISPQLATLTNKIPTGDDWLHEIKYDGYRLLSIIKSKKIQLLTRNQNDWTDKFVVIKNTLATLNFHNAIFDGEIVAINKKGKHDFQVLQNTIKGDEDAQLVYYIFDLLYYQGYSLLDTPLIERKSLLATLLPKKGEIQYSDHIIGQGKKVFKNACKLGLEGIISKNINAPYIQKRTQDWLKIKCKKEQEFVIGGYTEPKGTRSQFGSLLIGFYDKSTKLHYCGRVGTGFNQSSLHELINLLQKIKQKSSPFSSNTNIPELDAVTWVKPKLVVQVEYTSLTRDKILRHPSYKGLREDKKPSEVILEKEK